MEAFRYRQFCPLARAAEVLGPRWVLPLVRDLFVGPQRFSDLRRRMGGVSSSVLAIRLARLEAGGIVVRRELPPPAASTVYELTEAGRALEPALVELTRWGVRFLGPPAEDEHVEPSWLALGALAFARRGPSPSRRFALVPVGEDGSEAVIRVAGGPEGTRLLEDDGDPVDATVRAPVLVIMGLMSGRLPPAALRAREDVRVEGDAGALPDLPRLFEVDPSPTRPPRGEPA